MKRKEDISGLNEGEADEKRGCDAVGREREAESVRGEARQILFGGEIALLRIYCFKCNWVQPAPGEKIH